MDQEAVLYLIKEIIFEQMCKRYILAYEETKELLKDLQIDDDKAVEIINEWSTEFLIDFNENVRHSDFYDIDKETEINKETIQKAAEEVNKVYNIAHIFKAAGFDVSVRSIKIQHKETEDDEEESEDADE